MYGKNIETLKKENMNLADKIYIFDTTLRDGEQAPGVALTVDEKIQIAQKLDKLPAEDRSQIYDVIDTMIKHSKQAKP